MTATGIRWKIHDRYGNEIYLTHERWQHITAPINHPDMVNCEEHLKATIQLTTLLQLIRKGLGKKS